LRPVVTIVNTRQKLSLHDVLSLFDWLFDDLAQNLGAHGYVFVASHDVTGTSQQHSRGVGTPGGNHYSVDLDGMAGSARKGSKHARRHKRDKTRREYSREQPFPARGFGVGLSRPGDSERLEFRKIVLHSLNRHVAL